MTSAPIASAFEQDVILAPLDRILPLRRVTDEVKQSAKYRQIAHSVAEVGIIEPLVVSRAEDRPGFYLLLDGHLRHAVLSDAGRPQARCLIASDDEGFTYNKRINRLATIQEHYMIVKALERGVPEDRIARALALDVKAIRRRRALLTGISPEVVELLKDRSVNPTVFEVLRKMRPPAGRSRRIDDNRREFHRELLEGFACGHAPIGATPLGQAEGSGRLNLRADGADGARDGAAADGPQRN